jgi:hypothetical protein
MPKISDIPQLPDSAAELLNSAGFSEAAALAEAGAERAHAELLRTHKSSGRAGPPVDLGSVRLWVAAAQRLLGEAGPGGVPLAVPLSGRVLRDRGIPIAEVPLGIFPSGDEPAPEAARRSFTLGGRPALPVRTPLDHSKVRSVSDLKTPEQLLREEAEARRMPTNLLQVTRAKTNAGVNPASRRYVRGVLHPHRWRLTLGALITLVFVALLPVSVVAVILLLASDTAAAGQLDWVPKWLLAFPATLLVVGVLYLFISARVKCRICAQRLLVPKNCRKNNKAHHVRLLGHILPLSVHLLAFRWFRCTFCGTAVRLKE